jgi:hypothetical protein
MPLDHDRIASEVRSQFTCAHEKTEVRKRTDKAGRVLICRQCTRCGVQRGDYVSRKQYADGQLEALPEWDMSLEKRYGDALNGAMRSRFTSEKEKARNAFLKRHEAFLKSEVWKKLRAKVLKRAHGLCEGCGEAAATQVHHLNYTRWGGNELLIDLLAVCDSCHSKLHPKDKHPVDLLIESRNLPENNRGEFFDAGVP